MTVVLTSSQAQQNFGATMDRATLNEDVVIERYGTPRVAMMAYARYQHLLEAERQRRPDLMAPSGEGISDLSDLPAYRYITREPGVCGGRPIIQGTRTPVKSIVGYQKLGLTVDEILAGLPHLTPAQVHEALSFYHDHQAEIEREIEEDHLAHLRQRYGVQIAPDGRVLLSETAPDA